MDRHADEIMTSRLITIRTHETVRDAYHKMLTHRIRHLPVVDEEAGNQVVGIISERDVHRAGTGSALRADQIMSSPVCSVEETLPLREVAQTMINMRLSSLLVMGAGGVVRGIITTDDLLKFLIGTLGDDPNVCDTDVRDLFDEHFIQSIGY